nr:hypothetical protein [Tanacetum cinerariifolium]
MECLVTRFMVVNFEEFGVNPLRIKVEVFRGCGNGDISNDPDFAIYIDFVTSSKVALDQLVTKQVPGNIVRALSGRGKRKETISSKEVMFTKGDESSAKTAPEITFNFESECDIREHLPPLPKILGAEPNGTSADVITLVDLTRTPAVFEEIKKVHDKRSAVKAAKKKAQTMSPSVPNPVPIKKVDSSTRQLLLTLMELQSKPHKIIQHLSLKHRVPSLSKANKRLGLDTINTMGS